MNIDAGYEPIWLSSIRPFFKQFELSTVSPLTFNTYG